jgi:heme a synthase
MNSQRFYRLSLSTLVAVYVLILVGGIVRSTGSGMGCPDWPKCFGQWVPPTSVEELPENYKEVYSNHRHEKNIRFARYLSAFGFKATAQKILTDETIREEAEFNPVKTWIEYMNRLIGVTIGLLIFAVFVMSVQFWKTNRSLTLLAFATFVLVGFQGWIGSIVVSTNLMPWTITVHMFLALVIVAMLVFMVNRVSSLAERSMFIPGAFVWLIAAMVVLLIQILLGTQVRESIDVVANRLADRGEWIAALGMTFLIHRSFSWIVLLIHAMLIYKIIISGQAKGFGLSLILLILGTILSGSGMAYFAVPPFLQPVHLVFATITFGLQFLLFLRLNPETKIASASNE